MNFNWVQETSIKQVFANIFFNFGFAISKVSQVKSKTGSCNEERKLKKEMSYFRLVGGRLVYLFICLLVFGGRFNKQRNLHVRLTFGGHKMTRSQHPLTRMGLSHILSPDGFNNTLLSQGSILENDFHCGNSGESVHSKDKGECLGPDCQSTSGSTH